MDEFNFALFFSDFLLIDEASRTWEIASPSSVVTSDDGHVLLDFAGRETSLPKSQARMLPSDGAWIVARLDEIYAEFTRTMAEKDWDDFKVAARFLV